MAVLRLGRGLGILAGCWFGADWLGRALGLVVPGGVLGLVLLLVLLALRVVPLAWVEEASTLLLKWLPLLLLPAFVLATQDRTFLRTQGPLYVALITFTLLLLWGFIGWLAQWLFHRFPGPSDEPGPLTEAECALAEKEVDP